MSLPNPAYDSHIFLPLLLQLQTFGMQLESSPDIAVDVANPHFVDLGEHSFELGKESVGEALSVSLFKDVVQRQGNGDLDPFGDDLAVGHELAVLEPTPLDQDLFVGEAFIHADQPRLVVFIQKGNSDSLVFPIQVDTEGLVLEDDPAILKDAFLVCTDERTFTMLVIDLNERRLFHCCIQLLRGHFVK